MSFTRQAWIDRFVADLATVIGALVEATATAGQAAVAPSDGWVVTLRAEQGSRGELAVEFDRIATEVLTKRVMGMEIEPPNDVVVDTLKEICAQAAGSMVLEPPLVGTKLAVLSVERAAAAGAQEPVLVQIAVGDMVTLPLRLWGDVALATSQPPLQAPPPVANPKIDVILDIDLPLTVRFGRTELPLRNITALGPGSVIDLGRSPDDPVDVLVGSQVVARGEVVIVGGNYGIRITDVMSPADRVRSVESDL